MKHDDLGSKKLTVTVREVANVLGASIMAAKVSQMPPQVKECIVATVLSLFDEYIDDIQKYVDEKAKEEEDVAKFFSGMCDN